MSFAPVAKHYGAIVEPCPHRRGNRKGGVEAAVRFSRGRWWRTTTATTPEEAQVSPGPVLRNDRGWQAAATRPVDPPADASRPRRPTVGELAEAEALLALPAASYPATVEVTAPVAAHASVARLVINPKPV